MQDCIFCKIVEGEIPSNKVFESANLIAFEDISPVAPTHVLIVPKKHIATLNDVDDADANLLGEMILCAKRIAKDENLSEEGYRTVFNCMSGAGQAVMHIHLHLLGGRVFQWPPG
ncbi:MAG: histidine triad nucleotide-binding protein [Candidatus Latescibacterota bacterium]|nr:MAG: histidine triad nucleotide-binding protein [Candidatus Latescibacterota bacterium]